LLDAGTGVGGLELSRYVGIRHIFLTHSHLDHVTGIPLMIDSIFDQIEAPIILHGREETLKALQQYVFNWVIWPDFAQLPDADKPVMTYQVMEPGDTVEIDGRVFEMLPVNHAVPAAGYRISCAAGSIAFSGDTTTNDGFWRGLNRHESLDMLVVEAAFSNREMELSKLSRHYCPTLLAEDLRKLEHQPKVYVTHLKPGAETDIMRECAEEITDRDLHRLSSGDLLTL
jgi:cAMP phosphodiesterase